MCKPAALEMHPSVNRLNGATPISRFSRIMALRAPGMSAKTKADVVDCSSIQLGRDRASSEHGECAENRPENDALHRSDIDSALGSWGSVASRRL
jgi:hypothetical protein